MNQPTIAPFAAEQHEAAMIQPPPEKPVERDPLERLRRVLTVLENHGVDEMDLISVDSLGLAYDRPVVGFRRSKRAAFNHVAGGHEIRNDRGILSCTVGDVEFYIPANG